MAFHGPCEGCRKSHSKLSGWSCFHLLPALGDSLWSGKQPLPRKSLCLSCPLFVSMANVSLSHMERKLCAFWVKVGLPVYHNTKEADYPGADVPEPVSLTVSPILCYCWSCFIAHNPLALPLPPPVKVKTFGLNDERLITLRGVLQKAEGWTWWLCRVCVYVFQWWGVGWGFTLSRR